ncbi:MAG: hypothetical protein JRI68_15510 [Deltaproteobacteria bacterium]|nr:hypothetical protein [Deltaproteobacteria bacterium]
MRCRSLLFVVVAIALVQASCTPRPAKDGGNQLSVPRPHPADTIAVARYLPRGARALFVTSNLELLTERLGRTALIDLFRADYEEAVFRSVRKFGHDLTSPAGLRAMGIDTAGPAGIVALDGEGAPTTIVLFATVAEPERLKTAVYRLATGALTRGRRGSAPKVVGDGIIVGHDDWAVMMLPGVAMVVIGDDDAREIAARLARLPEGETAADHEPFRAVFGGLERTSLLRGYIDARGLTYGFLGFDPRWGGTSHSEALGRIEQSHRAALGRARARGAEVTEMVAIDDDHVAAREGLVGDDDVPWLRPLVGSVEGLGVALDVRTDGAELTLRAVLDPKGKVAPLINPQALRSTLVATVGEPPGLWLQLAIAPAMVLDLAELLGTKPAALSKTLGFDVERELLPLLTGEIAIAVTVKDRGVDALTKMNNLDALVLVGIRDPAAATGLLTKLTKVEALASLIGRGAKGGAVVTIPGLRPLFASTQGQYLAFSTDSKRKVNSSSKRLPRWLATSRATRLLAEPGAAATGTLDLELGMRALLALAEDAPGTAAMPYREPDVPASSAYEKKLNELERLDEKILETSRRAARRSMAPLLDLGRSLGMVGARIDPTPDGWVLRIVHATTGRPLVGLAAALAREGLELSEREAEVNDDALELFLERDQLFQDLGDIHDQEIREFDEAADKGGAAAAGTEDPE